MHWYSNFTLISKKDLKKNNSNFEFSLITAMAKLPAIQSWNHGMKTLLCQIRSKAIKTEVFRYF